MGFTPRLLSSVSLSHLGVSCSFSSYLLAHSKVLLVPRAPCFFRMEKETGEWRGLLELFVEDQPVESSP